ncbi:MAG: hypothetical protein IKB56_01905, partial [Clostridia bacterium]|nr:hypothetical protein [Clostridia bacterium]
MKKRTLSLVFAIFLISILLIAMTACDALGDGTTATRQLAQPSGLVVEKGILKWSTVNHANDYVVNIDGTDVAVVGNAISYQLEGLEIGKTYLLKVKARNTLGLYNDSWYSDPIEYVHEAFFEGTLAIPQNLNVSGRKLTWSAVAHADSYVVSIDGVEYDAVSTTSFDVSFLQVGFTYSLKVKAIDSSSSFDTSEYSKPYIYTPTNLPPLFLPTEPQVTDGVLNWTAVDNAVGYIVSLNGVDYPAMTNRFDMSTLNRDTTYIVKIKALADNVNYSDSEFTIEYVIDLNANSLNETLTFSQFEDLNQNESILSYGINMINHAMVSDRTIMISNPIFDIDLLRENTRLVKFNSGAYSNNYFHSSDVETFASSYNSNLNVNVSAKYKKIVSGAADVSRDYKTTSDEALSRYYTGVIITENRFYIAMQPKDKNDTADYNNLENKYEVEDTYVRCLSQNFINDINSDLHPIEIFERYGTHFITSVAMGGRIIANYNMSSYDKIVDTHTYTDVSAKIGASYKGIRVEGAVSYEQEINQKMAQSGISTEQSIYIYGGAGYANMTSIDKIVENYADWSNSLNTNPVVMGVKDSSSLRAIWSLIPKEVNEEKSYELPDGSTCYSRRDQLEAWFMEYGDDNLETLRESIGLKEMGVPKKIESVSIGSKTYKDDEVFYVDSGASYDIAVSCDAENEYTLYSPSFSLSEESKQYAEFDSEGTNTIKLRIKHASEITEPNAQVVLNIRYGRGRKTVVLRIKRKYEVTLDANLEQFGLKYDLIVKKITEGATNLSEPLIVDV